MAENTEQSSILAKESTPLQTIKTDPVKLKEKKERRRSPHRTEAREEQISQGYKSSEKTESKFTMLGFIVLHLRLDENEAKCNGQSDRLNMTGKHDG